MRVRFILLALLGSMLVAFGSTPTATAATVVPCVRTFAGPAKAIAPETSPTTGSAYTWTTSGLTVPSAMSNVEDIDVTFDITHPHASKLSIRLTRMEGATVTKSIALHGKLGTKTGAEPRPLTFDDEAAGVYGTTSPTGRYKPDTVLSSFDGSAAQATWRLDVANYENVTAKINAWSVRISLTTCDADGDGAEEHSDNCAGVANPDQADLDADRLGDACDPDLDNDLVPNAYDNCLTVPNTDQVDTDRNGLGDVCTGDDDGDTRDDTADGCPLVAGATASGCPSVARSLSITWVHKRKTRKLIGSVTSGLPGCRAEVEVTLWRKRRGADRRLVVVRTDGAGRYRVRSPRDPGKYYVTVPQVYLAHIAECAPGRSSSARVRR